MTMVSGGYYPEGPKVDVEYTSFLKRVIIKSWPAKFSDLLGETLKEVFVSDDKTEMYFITDGNYGFKMIHDQDCCEEVKIDDINGDLLDLIDSKITMASEQVSHENPPTDFYSFTWTFYKLATAKGYVDIRWLGESNGYYSESVEIHQIMLEP